MKRITFIMILLCSVFKVINAQNNLISYPEIGKQCPTFNFKDVYYYSQKALALSDLKGKFFILDLWAINCSSCIASFPKINHLQQQFSDKLQFVLVGYDNGNSIRNVYETYKKKLNLHLSITYDSIIFNQFEVESVPYVVWVDDKGIVKAVTSSSDVTEKNIIDFLAGKKFVFYDCSIAAKERMKKSFNETKPMFINGNGGRDTSYDFRSIISVWDKTTQPIYMMSDIAGFLYISSLYKQKGINKMSDYPFMGVSLQTLYQIAYLGKEMQIGINDNHSIWGYPAVIEVKDKQRLANRLNNSYNYALHFPEAVSLTEAYIMQVMQHNLEDYFRYKGVIEYRNMPCLKLVVTNIGLVRKALKVTDTTQFMSTPSSLIVCNTTIDLICDFLGSYLDNPKLPVINNTGISGKVNFKIDSVARNDWHELKKAIRKYGFDLVPSTIRIKTLIIKDVNT